MNGNTRRIERKCDLLLAQIEMLRKEIDTYNRIDKAIAILHDSAVRNRMRSQRGQ